MSPTGGAARRRRQVLAAVAGVAAAGALLTPATATADPPGRYSAGQLKAAGEAVLTADVAGTAWHVDEKTNSLALTADSTVSAGDLAKIRRKAGGNAGAIRVVRTHGRFVPYLSGGDAVFSQSRRCSAGFNVRKGGTYYFLTAGHCTKGTGSWFTDSALSSLVGPTAGSSFPGNDYGRVRYVNPAVPHPGTVADVDITRAATPAVGQTVKRRGSTTGTRTGRVTALDATVNYGHGDVVRGLIQTDLCAEAGDSGGALYSGTTAHGLTSGGSGSCSAGGTTFFQPVTEALRAYGVQVY